MGIIYKLQGKADASLDVSVGSLSSSLSVHADFACMQCFHYILADPPAPLKKQDVWYQIGHALELKKDVSASASNGLACRWRRLTRQRSWQFMAARDAYERVLRTTPDHSKVLQHLGGLYLRETVPFHNPEQCIKYVSLSLEHGRQHDSMFGHLAEALWARWCLQADGVAHVLSCLLSAFVRLARPFLLVHTRAGIHADA